MVWCSGWRLASAVSNAGGLGLLGAGSMHPETLREHIRKTKGATDKPWGVNIPLMYPEMDSVLGIIEEERVPIVFTSAGSPKKYTRWLHDRGIKVAHVVSSSKFAIKCEEAGVDAIVAEGFEAGGHNGREESTTMTLIPQVRKATTLSGQAMLASMALGAEGVQMGTVFALSKESSASDAYKQACTAMEEGGTMLCLKKIAPTRLLRNGLFNRISEAEARGASADELRQLLGAKASKRGIFEGDTENGEMEIGQIASDIKTIDSVEDIMNRITTEYKETKQRIITL